MKKTILLAFISAFTLWGCIGGSDSSEKEWTSFIYPDKTNTKRSKSFGKYNTLKQCQEASKTELKNQDLETRGFYECGLNCSYHEGMKVEICEKMSK